MRATDHRRRVSRLAPLTVLAWLAAAMWAPSVSAIPGYYTDECEGCHSATNPAYTTNTCAGCHAHGVHSSSAKSDINVTATPDSATYNPGDPMTVSVSGGYRSGWVRAQMWDLNCSAAGTCNQGNALVSESLYTSGTTANFPGPVLLEATAPMTPGTYTWYAGWYGNERDAANGAFGLWIADTTNGGHGNELVAVEFTVAGSTNTPPVAVNDQASTDQNVPAELDLVENDNDADGDTLFVNDDYDIASAQNGEIFCDTGATTPDPQCTYTPDVDYCGNDSFTYRAFDGTDASANRATVSIQVGDSEPPTVTAPTPDPLEIFVPEGTTSVPATDPTIAAWLASASAEDPQDGTVPVENNALANFPVGTTTVTFTATDSCGNVGSAQADVQIIIVPNLPPVVTAPAPLAVTAPLCATSVPQTDVTIAEWLASATAVDPEDGDVTDSITDNAPVDFPLGDTVVAFTATDSEGLEGSADSTLTVNETPNTAPTVTAPTPDPLEIEVPVGTTSVPATDPAIAAWLDSASAEDAEDGPLTVTNNALADFPLGTTTVTFTATDSCGLTTTATAAVTITEVVNTPPVLTVPADLTVEGEVCATSIPATDPVIADWLASATATDVEDGDLTGSITNDAPANFPASMAPGTATTVEFSVTDSGDPTGNPATSTATSTLTAVDPNTAPTVTAPAPLEIVVPAGTTSVPATDAEIAGWLASASATDAEDGGLNVTNNAPADFPLGTTTVTFTATDSCGVSDTATSTVTITEEGTADVWISDLKVPKKVNAKVGGRTVTKSITVRADGDTVAQDATVTLSVMDVPAFVQVPPPDPESITGVVEPGNPETQFRWFTAYITCFGEGTGTVTWEASIDAAQNSDGTNDILTGTSEVTCR